MAPFETVGVSGPAWPDVATLLAQRLSTRGVERVVGPDQLEASALADPPADRVVAWASEAAVGTLVVGRATRIGARLSVDARLRSGSSGARLGSPFFAEIRPGEDPAQAVDSLAGDVLARLEVAEPAPAAVTAAPPASAAPGAAATPEASGRLGYRRDQPIEIHADELEAVNAEGRRRFLFRGNVRAVQGRLSLRSDRLEALYPADGSQPERLVATGNVAMTQGDRRAFCDRAVFHRTQDRVVCTGNARLEQACDHVRGREIVFQLDRELLQVNGAADVRIHPRGAPCAARAEAAP